MILLRKEEYLHPRVLILKNSENYSAIDILNNIHYGDIESIQILEAQNIVRISFFNYLDLYLTLKDISTKFDWDLETVPFQLNTKNAYLCGATRVIRITDYNNTEEHFQDLVLKFGEIEYTNFDENHFDVAFLSILSALKFAKFIHSNNEYKNKIFFENDHCSDKKREQNDEFIPQFYSKNRTVYLGGIQENMSSEDIYSAIKGGYIFSLKILREKKCAFIVFMDVNAANAFLMYYENNDFVIRNHKLKVSKGTETKIAMQHILMCYAGASRSIIIDGSEKRMTKDMLINDFGRFGEIEQINIITNKKLIFINYMCLQEAFNAYIHLKNKDEYKNCRIGFGKDRCYNETTEEMMHKVVMQKQDMV